MSARLDIHRILVILIRGGMGDVLVSTPVLDALKRRYPEAPMDMMVRPGARAMVEHHPALSELFIVPDGELEVRDGFQRWMRDVRTRKYDLGVVLWSRFSEAWLLYRAGIPHRVGQDSRLTYSWTYTHRVRVRSEHGDCTSHQVQCQLDYARAVGADLDDPRPRLYLDEQARRDATEILAASDVADPFMVLHVGRGTRLDRTRLPTMPFARIGDALSRECQGKVVLTGGDAEREVVDAVAASMEEEAVSLAGRLTVPQLGAVLERARFVVANDSGPMHMAAAVGTPTVGIFAMEKDLPHRWGPWENAVVRPQTFRCRPDCLKETCARMSCYEDVTPEMVMSAVRSVTSPVP